MLVFYHYTESTDAPQPKRLWFDLVAVRGFATRNVRPGSVEWRPDRAVTSSSPPQEVFGAAGTANGPGPRADRVVAPGECRHKRYSALRRACQSVPTVAPSHRRAIGCCARQGRAPSRFEAGQRDARHPRPRAADRFRARGRSYSTRPREYTSDRIEAGSTNPVRPGRA